jgi:hypothetical protein
VSYRESEYLRVVIANERKDRLALVAPIVVALGHEVIACEIDIQDVGPVTGSGATRRRAQSDSEPMGRRSIGEESPFEMLREQSRVANRKLIDRRGHRRRPSATPQESRLPPRRDAQMWQGGHLRCSGLPRELGAACGSSAVWLDLSG